MSIAPVQSFPPDRSEPPESSSGRAGETPAKTAPQPAEEGAVSGTLPKQETSAEKIVPSTYELPPDVVEVHHDPEIKSQVIVQYLDQAKNLILQVPSSQELGVERGIAQDVQQAAKLRTSADTSAAGSEGEKTHGD
jgi:hypothetical protein